MDSDSLKKTYDEVANLLQIQLILPQKIQKSL